MHCFLYSLSFSAVFWYKNVVSFCSNLSQIQTCCQCQMKIYFTGKTNVHSKLLVMLANILLITYRFLSKCKRENAMLSIHKAFCEFISNNNYGNVEGRHCRNASLSCKELWEWTPRFHSCMRMTKAVVFPEYVWQDRMIPYL